ncbi:MAG: uroporphyrinogen decarboxylase family protein [Promethearchaeota archaeon]
MRKSDFINCLCKKSYEATPIYCTGYPTKEFLYKYMKNYQISENKLNDLIFEGKNYSLIKNIGFDAISIWDYRRGEGGYKINGKLRVDGWGRIYRGNWYQWDGVFKDEKTIDNWPHLNLPNKEKFKKLSVFLSKLNEIIDIVFSLPGLFEKTWQSMGILHFSKSLRKNIKFIEYVADFFLDYIKKLIINLQKAGAEIFIIADDLGYNSRLFISKEIWSSLFYEKYAEIIKLVHKSNHKIILHSDGFITPLIPEIIELGFDGIQSLEPNAGVDIFSLFKQYQGQICFIGNIDNSLLAYGTPIDIKIYVKKLIAAARKTNNFLVVSPTQQIDNSVRVKNLNAMIHAAKSTKN